MSRKSIKNPKTKAKEQRNSNKKKIILKKTLKRSNQKHTIKEI